MTGSSPSGLGKTGRKRPFPFGLVMLLFGLGLGFYGGISATRSAMKGPMWVQRIFGISYIASAVAAAPAPAQMPTQPPANVIPVPAAPSSPPADQAAPAPDGTGTAPNSDTAVNSGNTQTPAKLDKPGKKHAVNSKDLEGFWSTTDTLPGETGATSSVTSTYVFNSDNTGEFDSNGRKLYDFRWKLDGDDLAIDFEGEGPDPNQPWSVKLKWSLNGDKSVLTLVPSNGKDPRNFVYSISGPGVYHRKSQGPGNS